MDNIAKTISDTIWDAATKSIPNKWATIRPNDVPWFNSHLRTLIRKRNRMHKQAKINNTDLLWSRFRKIRNEVTALIRKSKLEYKNKLIKKINDDKLTARNWFKLAKKVNKHTYFIGYTYTF